MNTKLTLSLDSSVIESAKKISKQKGISLSKLIESYLMQITERDKKKKKSSLMELKGILGKAPSNYNYKEEVYKYRAEKHK